MSRLAGSVARLELLIADSDMNFAQRREAVIEELIKVEELSDSLGAGYKKTNHLFIDEHIDDFKAEVRRARLAVEREPPDYYLVGRIAGNCAACHRQR